MKTYLLYLMLLTVLFSPFCSIHQESAPPIKTEPQERESQEQPLANGVFQKGIASWYGSDFNGKRTANGEIYDMYKLTAAHQKLPFHTLIEVENLDNQMKVLVRINDRGPFVKNRIIDLSKKAAEKIDMVKTGTAAVRLRIIKKSELGTYLGKKSSDSPSPLSTKITTPPVTTPVEQSPIQQEQRIEPETVTSEPIHTQIQLTVDGFYLQAGAFSSRKNSLRLVEHLNDVLPQYKFAVKYLDGFYKVVSLNFSTRKEAEKARQILKENNFDTLIKNTK
jgi:peptidoglycan lytic transglycosylase